MGLPEANHRALWARYQLPLLYWYKQNSAGFPGILHAVISSLLNLELRASLGLIPVLWLHSSQF